MMILPLTYHGATLPAALKGVNDSVAEVCHQEMDVRRETVPEITPSPDATPGPWATY